MAVPIDLLNNSEPSSDEDFSDSEISYPSEDESSEIITPRETDTNRGEGDEFWIRYPYLKIVIDTIVAQGLVPKDSAYERAKLLGDDEEEAKKLNEEGNAQFLMEIEI